MHVSCLPPNVALRSSLDSYVLSRQASRSSIRAGCSCDIYVVATGNESTLSASLYIKRGKVSVRTDVRTSVTVGVTSSVADDVTMRMTS